MDGVDGPVPVICGPTAAGKSALATWLAQRFGGSIVVADSRQIYRGFDVGTAKPTREERRAIPHFGVDVASPTQRYSAATWANDAVGWLAAAERDGSIPIVVGGTGFYLRALFEPLFEEPELEPARRRALEGALAGMSVTELARWAKTLDPARAHLGRAQLLRAIEVATLSGRRLSDLHRERARPAKRTARYLVVDPGDALVGRILDRIDAMLAGGWVEEVRTLMETVPEDAPAWKSTGYRAVRRVARDDLRVDAARAAILVETRQYAKRQRTWFRHQLPERAVTRVDPRAADALMVAERWWRQVAHEREAAS